MTSEQAETDFVQALDALDGKVSVEKQQDISYFSIKESAARAEMSAKYKQRMKDFLNVHKKTSDPVETIETKKRLSEDIAELKKKGTDRFGGLTSVPKAVRNIFY
jgi:hypothetical protein